MQADIPAWAPEGREGRSQEALPALSAHPAHPASCILNCRGVKHAATKPAASKADYSRPRRTIADQDRLEQTKAEHGRPKHSDIRGATSISDAFI